jgi:L-cysteate sulfo-lyase
LGFTPRAIVHCSGSGGTKAGLALGAASVLPETDIVDIDAEPERVAADVRQYARAAAEVLEVSFDDGVSRWSQATRAEPMAPFKKPQSRRCSWLAGRLEALVLDPVYSAKGLAGLVALARGGRWSATDDVVFVHTGGAPTLFAYEKALGV